MAYTDKVKEQVMQWFRATPDGSIDDAQHDCLIATSVSPRHGFLYECRRRVQDSIKAKQVEEAQELWHVHPDTIPDKYKVIGCFGCVHLPAEVPGALEFVKSTFRARGVNIIVANGDIFDFHAASRWPSEDKLPTADAEFELVKERFKPWADSFPYAYFMEGNHDRIPKRLAASVGMSQLFVADYYKMLGVPEGWQVSNNYRLIAGVEFDHGEGSGGMYGCINTAKDKSGSFVQNHTHSYGAVIYRANTRKLFFGMNCGCLCDTMHDAMNYSSKMPKKGTVGCGVVYSPSHAEFIPMDLSRRED